MAQYNAEISTYDKKNLYYPNSINSLMLIIKNIGSETWYAYDKLNPITVGCQYIDKTGGVVEGFRTKLPYNVIPGESIIVNANFDSRNIRKYTHIVFDLVHEQKSWFKEYGSKPLTINILELGNKEVANQTEDIVVSCRNISKKFKTYPSQLKKFFEIASFNTYKTHSEHWALKDISFDVKKGETYGIIGFNGSGKSTLLSILAQTKSPSLGTFLVNGRIAALLELGAGFHPELTGRENVKYNSYLHGISSTDIQKKMDSIKEFSGIGDYFDKPVKNYSSGMYVRLAFSLAIHVDPDILIIDEALAVGDEVFQRKCYAKFEEFKAEGKTIILVTHDLNAVRTLCDRVSIIYDGNKIYEGTSNEVANYYQKMALTANLEVQAKQNQSDNKMRYGNGKGRIVSYQLQNSNIDEESIVYRTGESIRIKVEIEVKDKIVLPVIGVIFKTINGVEVYGTNSRLLDCNIGEVYPQQKIFCEMTIPLYLNEGNYFISLGLSDHHSGETITVDRMVDVTFIRVISDVPCLGVANFNIGAEAKAYVH
ncbi:ABC transporter ATP-binding protein [Paenibacillus dendritiformis]|uniref:ABC transporter ATP-binding protein n=1 Tax=Paenibacillus dendritiformis TaxID=130049 RepID=UPI00248B8DBC|nr:ABC transporter ATP-binding protein [Paenibacillus dendritiformis]WGU93810.1 ABC transporter ATP-binding protein [Paenibacillus dendritiformis]